jgi:DNA-binding HxlR family transcriptional regulator
LQKASQQFEEWGCPNVPVHQGGHVPCPIGRAVDVLGDRWTLLILRNATMGVTRFEDFRAELGIADNILSKRLARLVDAGVLVRVPYRAPQRTRHEYRLTTAGADALAVLHALAGWGQEHTEPSVHVEPMRMIHDRCGSDLAPGAYCETCDRVVEREEIAWVRPWRSADPLPLADPV